MEEIKIQLHAGRAREIRLMGGKLDRLEDRDWLEMERKLSEEKLIFDLFPSSIEAWSDKFLLSIKPSSLRRELKLMGRKEW